jgi:hypothetical protein
MGGGGEGVRGRGWFLATGGGFKGMMMVLMVHVPAGSGWPEDNILIFSTTKM